MKLINSNQFDKRTLLENIDYVLLALDELVDGGIILESEPSILASRVAMKGADTGYLLILSYFGSLSSIYYGVLNLI